MSLLYRVLYGLGITPWEQMASLPIAKQIAGLFDREEQQRAGRRRRALDLGCGSGIWSVELAKRGWDVTGVDLVPKALRAARERAQRSGVDVRFVRADLTTMSSEEVGRDFDLLLDFGALHGMARAQQERMSLAVTALAASPATLLMLAFTPGRRGPLPRGLSQEEVTAIYRGWEVDEVLPQDVTEAPRMIRKARPKWYRLCRS